MCVCVCVSVCVVNSSGIKLLARAHVCTRVTRVCIGACVMNSSGISLLARAPVYMYVCVCGQLFWHHLCCHVYFCACVCVWSVCVCMCVCTFVCVYVCVCVCQRMQMRNACACVRVSMCRCACARSLIDPVSFRKTATYNALLTTCSCTQKICAKKVRKESAYVHSRRGRVGSVGEMSSEEPMGGRGSPK